MKVKIFIETSQTADGSTSKLHTNEWHFISQYIRHLLPDIKKDEYEIVGVSGKDNLRHYDNMMRENAIEGGTNLVVFDCDRVETGGGMEIRTAWLEELKRENGMEFSYFFFPNNSDDGMFEDLLLHIINPSHNGIMECFSQYEMCVSGQNALKGGKVYSLPNVKAKIYTYITTFRFSRKKMERIKSGDWDFGNGEYWDLDSKYLDPLKDFLLSALRNKQDKV